MEIRHGRLLGTRGDPARHEAWTFTLARVELGGTSFRLADRLGDHLAALAAPSLGEAVREQFDATWVRARIPRVFGSAPDPSETEGIEKALLHAGFAAIDAGGASCTPFICTDHYGRSALIFGTDDPEDAANRSIAGAFWDLLLREPEDLADFEQRVYHSGAGGWLIYRCESGRVSCDFEEDVVPDEAGS